MYLWINVNVECSDYFIDNVLKVTVNKRIFDISVFILLIVMDQRQFSAENLRKNN